ncbi:SMP-30/gluconolactonase/LRE family protein [Bosea sp. (in: a-proteobacteria)]|jgi:sugar lactone lactonase YvrE|uniref:SMP-30/gluconolactonase/LRE family protein n=1 Tax=Bosea sp. (in: a-proteobacteria) TaxID=1871050 RepID=UPI003F6EC471
MRPIPLSEVSLLGEGLVRPECVLATARGDLYTADWRGGVAHLKPDGTQALYAGATADLPEGLRPNGIALEPDGSFLIANLGSEAGGVWRLTRDGQVSPVLVEIAGVAIPPSNYVVRDGLGRLWLTVSTRLQPRSLDYRRDSETGFVVVMDEKGARIAADGLGFTNECQVTPDGRWLYVNETYGRRLSRFPLQADASLGSKEVVHEFGDGQFPDGLAFDAEGKIWIAGVISNQLSRIDPETGAAELVLHETDDAHVAWVEAAYRANALGRPHMDATPATKLKNLSSIAFGGPDLRTGYLGCLLGGSIGCVRLPVAGAKPVHWTY